MASRRDNKGRILNKGEYQRSNGMYEYKHIEIDGKSRSVYSWRLNQIDKAPKGKHSEFCLRELIQQIERDKQDGINSSEAADEMRPQLRYVYGKGAEKVDRRLTFQTAVICDTINHILVG